MIYLCLYRIFDMIAILTGDIINSRSVIVNKWLPLLKEALSHYGDEPKTWEIYRGDSFQLKTRPEQALEAALLLKATLKQHKSLDVRIAIGLGEKDHDATKISEANGSAFVHSGRCFENLKKQRLAFQSNYPEFDLTLNTMLQLASLTIDQWPPVTAGVVKTAILHPNKDQKALATLLNKAQPNISRDLKRAGYEELTQLLSFYTTKVAQL